MVVAVPHRFAVIGAGAWGTALACNLARNGNAVRLWGRDAAQLAAIQSTRRNSRYLPDTAIPDTVRAEPSLAAAVDNCTDVLVAVPSNAFRDTLEALAAVVMRPVKLCWATKGLEPTSGRFLHEVAREVFGSQVTRAVISGPSFAKEVGDGLPTAVTLASANADYGNALVEAFHNDHFRVYSSIDVIGAEIGGAVKNVIAIAAGISDGLAFGANARAALITRGLAEIMRLGTALGARPETITGLTGLGDLVLTCTGSLSRNRRLGLALAGGDSVDKAAGDIGQAIEGIGAADAVYALATQNHVEMPITRQVRRVLHDNLPARDAVVSLLSRAPKSEHG